MPGVDAMALVIVGLAAGPALVVLAVAARLSESALSMDVTWRDCARAAFGRSPVIAPEIGHWRLGPIPQADSPTIPAT